MSVPAAAVYFKKGRVFVACTYSPGPGTYIDKDPVFEISSAEVNKIGESVLDAFDHFVDGGEMPDWDTYPKYVLKAAGVGTWNEFNKGLKTCTIYSHEDHFVIRCDSGPMTLSRESSAEKVGSAVLKAFGTTKEKEIKKLEKK